MRKILLPLLSAASLAMGTCHLTADDAAASGKPPIEKPAARLVDAAEAEKLIAARKVIVLDVRTPQEFAAAHISGATNLNFHSKDFQQQLDRLDKQQTYLVHCAVGGRSARACKLMSELEFKTVYDLKGGLNAWEKAGKPVVK